MKCIDPMRYGILLFCERKVITLEDSDGFNEEKGFFSDIKNIDVIDAYPDSNGLRPE